MPRERPSDPLQALRVGWGYDRFRPGQQPVIDAVLAGRDAMAVLPTGGGKSLLYQVPALVTGGLVLVVSPLVALMRDQVASLHARGIGAAAVHSGLPAHAQDQLWTDAEYGKHAIVYLTPERLETRLFADRAPRLPVRLLAVDEAHCVSEWGHDFRPAYRRLGAARDALERARGERVPTLAVTATATPPVRADIEQQLALRDPLRVVQGFDRPNLVWSVHRVEDAEAQARAVFEAVPGSGVVYASTRRGTEAWARRLSALGVVAEAYHAGLPRPVREAVQDRWMTDRTRVVVATSAFGMGVDKPDVRAVVHVALPPTLEAYYQEAGRAGRDGRRAYAALVVAPDADRVPRRLLDAGHPTASDVRAVYDAAASLAQLAVGAEPDGPTVLDPGRVADVTGLSQPSVRAAVARIAETGVWAVTEPRDDTVWVRARGTPGQLAAAASGPGAGFTDALARALPATAFGTWAGVRLGRLAERLRRPAEQVRAGLASLQARGALDVVDAPSGLLVTWLAARSGRLVLDSRAVDGARARALSRLDDVVAYAQSIGCRRRHLLAYFGERAEAPCGRCDVCLGRHRPAVVTPSDEPDLVRILGAVAGGQARPSWLPHATPRTRDALADWLVGEGYLEVTDPLTDAYALTDAGAARLQAAGRVRR